MNGIHDMGGMQGLGEIGYKENEPDFHEPSEVTVPCWRSRARTEYQSDHMVNLSSFKIPVDRL